MSSKEQPCKQLRHCEARVQGPTSDSNDRALGSATSRLWEQGDTAGRALTSGIDKAAADHAQHIAENPLGDEVSTGMPGLDDALSRLRKASQEFTTDFSLDVRSMLLGAAALPECATCPLNLENQ